MIYVTGDIHGTIDIRKLLKNNVTEKITENDYVIICGDFGLVWNYKKEDGKERKWLKWLNNQRWTTLFVDGNHECFPRLNSFPVKEWHGGRVHEVRPKVLHLMRGEIFEIEGSTFFAMGGASSHDRGPAKGDTDAVIGKSWWPEEIPSDEEMEYALKNLEKHGNKVDYIITHCLPTMYQGFVKQGQFPPDKVSEFFEKVNSIVKYEYWYSGHYHCNVDVTRNMSVVYSRIIPVGMPVRNADIIMGIPKYRTGETVLTMNGDEPALAMVLKVEPWGPVLKRSDEPMYEITFFGDDFSEKGIMIKESQIIEKSLIYEEEEEEDIDA